MVVEQARKKKLMSDEDFTANCTLIGSYATYKRLPSEGIIGMERR